MQGRLLPMVAEIIMESVFPEEEIKLFKQNNKQRLEVNLKKGDFVANRLIDTYLYGENHPYGKVSSFEAPGSAGKKTVTGFL
jgi:predicted Zn-dependent peptidase